MKIYPVKEEQKENVSYDHLTPIQKKMRQAALLLAFVSVFVFFVKIMFM